MKSVALLGDTSKASAFSSVNRRWMRGLTARGWAVGTDEGASALRLYKDFTVDFSRLEPPPGRNLAVRTWDFGPYPPAWVALIQRSFQRLCVHSNWIRAKALESGLSPELTAVVPHGIDPRIMRADGRARAWEEERFRFLFVGAAVHRKGLDVLLKAYTRAFCAGDPVSLVIKDHRGDVFYQGLSYAEQIRQLAVEPDAPQIMYLDEYMPEEELAALIRGCQAGVFPYRAEGFATPILECMACGLPCLVPKFGACLDYCSPENSFLLPVRRICAPVRSRFTFNTLGFQEELTGIDFCEIAPDSLAQSMREVYQLSETSRRERGLQAAAEARSLWTWDQALDRLEALLMEECQSMTR